MMLGFLSRRKSQLLQFCSRKSEVCCLVSYSCILCFALDINEDLHGRNILDRIDLDLDPGMSVSRLGQLMDKRRAGPLCKRRLRGSYCLLSAVMAANL